MFNLALNFSSMSTVMDSRSYCGIQSHSSRAQESSRESGQLSISRQGVVYAMTIVVLSKIFRYTGVLAAQACADVLTAVMAGLIIRHIFFRHKDHNV